MIQHSLAARLCGLMTVVLLALPSGAQAQNWLDQAKDAWSALDEAAPEGSGLGSDEIAAGLREALAVGTEKVVDQVGTTDGFNGDPSIHIPLPGALQDVQSALRAVGMAEMADDLELRLNRGAEAAAPEAKALFVEAISRMTLEDAQAIYDGPDDAATQYFKQAMSEPLAERMAPIVDRSLADVGAVKSYDAMMGQYDTIPFVPDVKSDLTGYVVDQALDGIFYYVAKEEAAIRNNPAARTTELLQKVFGSS
ncbi:MAG: DUF4197 domain-containing protein [Pseudomonadota bacterium]